MGSAYRTHLPPEVTAHTPASKGARCSPTGAAGLPARRCPLQPQQPMASPLFSLHRLAGGEISPPQLPLAQVSIHLLQLLLNKIQQISSTCTSLAPSSSPALLYSREISLQGSVHLCCSALPTPVMQFLIYISKGCKFAPKSP